MSGEMNRRGFIKGAGVFAAAGGGLGISRPTKDVVGSVAPRAELGDGAKTLVVERGNCLGGMATRGLVGPFMTCYDKSGKTQIIRGLFNEIVERLVARGAAIHPRDCMGGTAFTSWGQTP